ncbi:MAG: tetratricopeptide repeat protein, partial [Gemmatimonadales bacterium]
QETSGCDQALAVFQAAVRRSRSNEIRTRAEDGVAGCSVALGFRAEAAGKTEDAALWFAAAIRVDSSTPVGRRALVGYGDAQARLGDTAAAVDAYRAVTGDAVQSDSTMQMARDRLEELRARTSSPLTGTILR